MTVIWKYAPACLRARLTLVEVVANQMQCPDERPVEREIFLSIL